MKAPFVLFLALLLCGCANVEYTAYSGQQQNWPVASGSFVQRKFGLPVYMGPPDRRYRVIGFIEVETPPAGVFQHPEAIQPAVQEAQKHGADALVVLSNTISNAGYATFNNQYVTAQSNWNNATASGFGSSTTLPMRRGYSRAWAIQFL
jgi:hypothetical protein